MRSIIDGESNFYVIPNRAVGMDFVVGELEVMKKYLTFIRLL